VLQGGEQAGDLGDGRRDHAGVGWRRLAGPEPELSKLKAVMAAALLGEVALSLGCNTSEPH
jgi:hypothetical protein